MSDFFQLFQPGLRHQQEQRDLEKILVVDQDVGGTGPKPLDLESGSVVVRFSGTAADSTPPVPDPDDKDWTWVLEQRCPECGFQADEVSVVNLPQLVAEAAAPWADVLARPDAAERPAPQVWSPVEYACHVRDVLIIFAERARLIRDQDDPQFANWDQDATAIAERYWEQVPAAVAQELALAARTNAAVWTDVTEAEWQRPGRRSNGSVFTLETLGRYFLHDLRHHLVDVGA
jgi:hypothetical protein